MVYKCFVFTGQRSVIDLRETVIPKADLLSVSITLDLRLRRRYNVKTTQAERLGMTGWLLASDSDKRRGIPEGISQQKTIF